MGVTVDVTERKTMEETLRQRLEEIDALKRQLNEENLYLRDEIMLQHGHEEIVGRSAAMKQFWRGWSKWLKRMPPFC